MSLSFILPFLTLKEISKLDRSLTNHSVRNIWVQMPKQLNNNVTLNIKSMSSIEWCIRKNIFIYKLNLNLDTSDENLPLTQLGFDYGKLRSLFLLWKAYLYNLTHIKVHKNNAILSFVVSDRSILSSCKKLMNISFQNQSYIPPLLSNGHIITTLHIKDCVLSQYDINLASLLQHLKHLKYKYMFVNR